MAITVGTDGYISVDDAKAYILAYVDADYGESDADLEVSIRKSTLAMERLYGGRFIGTPTATDQALHFPVDGDTEIPTEVGQACAELAYEMLVNFLDPYAEPAPKVTELDEQVDVLKTSTKYAYPTGANPLYKIDLVIAPYIYSKSGFRFSDVVLA